MAHRISAEGGRESGRDLVGIDFGDLLPQRRPARVGPTPLTRLQARLRRASLDRALARGADPCESPSLAHRAARLTAERHRKSLAAWIEEAHARARRPARPSSVAVEPHRVEVGAAAAQLAQVRELLRSRAPIYARGVAMLEGMLRSGGSALYLPTWRGELSHELELIIAALEGREAFASSSVEADGGQE